MRRSLVAVCVLLLTPGTGFAGKSQGLTPGRHVLEGE